MKCFVGLLAVLGCCGLANADSVNGNLYLTAGDQRTVLVVSGSGVVNQWNLANAEEYPLAVDTTVRTLGLGSGPNVNGSYLPGEQYTLSGTATGVGYTNPGFESYDGTSDGVSNYVVDFTNGNVLRTQQDWTNPTVLFNTGSAYQNIGISYDPNNNSLWVSGWSTDTVTDYSMTGTVISLFHTGHNNNAALAFDPKDGSLWLNWNRSGNLSLALEHYDTSGSLLGTIGFQGTNYAYDNVLGAEFAEPSQVTAAPEPSSLLLLGTGLIGGIGAMGRKLSR